MTGAFGISEFSPTRLFAYCQRAVPDTTASLKVFEDHLISYIGCQIREGVLLGLRSSKLLQVCSGYHDDLQSVFGTMCAEEWEY